MTSNTTEFLVRIDIDTGGLDEERVDALRRAEGKRARELAAAGHLVKLWRVPGQWANYGVWRAPDQAELVRLLDSLPLRPHMTLTVQPLTPHPSDPARQVDWP